MVKAIQDKLDVEVATHCRTKAEMNKLHEEETKKEGTIMALREVAQKKQAWYNEQGGLREMEALESINACNGSRTKHNRLCLAYIKGIETL